MEARIEWDGAELRSHLVVLLILGMAITLRSLFIAGDDARRGVVDMPIAHEVQLDFSHPASSR